jgi:putative RNA 2'-phosphotransferase
MKMNEKEIVKTSKFLSLVLRHEPERIGLMLDSAGWVDVDALLAACCGNGNPIERTDLEEVVRTSDKKRFALSDDGQKIRANQGHSVEVELGYTQQTPPARLFHGTASRFIESIRVKGLLKGERHHVHLSLEEATAQNVGQRHGKPVVLVVNAEAMHAAGREFFLSENGVWLTDHVPAEYLEFSREQRSSNTSATSFPR